MNDRNINKSVSVLRGVGETRRAALEKMGIVTLGDLLRHYPRAYQNRGDTKTLSEIRELVRAGEEGPFSAILTVSCEPSTAMPRRGMYITKVKLFDETGAAEAVYFNQQYLRDVMHTGSEFRFYGKFTLSNSRLQISNPIYEPYVEGRALPGIVPVYPLTSGITQKLMNQMVAEAMKLCAAELLEYMPQHIVAEAKLPTYAYTLTNIHFPESAEAIAKAKRRLTFDELYLMFLSLAVNGEKSKRKNTKQIVNRDIAPFLALLPFEMTGAQKRSVGEIISDMAGEHLMNRILTGDVGSGKTAVCEAAVFAAVNNGYRAAVMVPTEILANQHFEHFEKIFAPLGIKCALLTGKTKKSDKTKILRSLSDACPLDDRIDVVIGTHSLISDDVTIDRLGLCVIDEQHRFGVMQRAALFEKAAEVHSLVMSATPIPRTLTLAAYGSIDVSRIDELPAGRQKIDTFIVNEGYRERLNAFIAKQAAEGHQVYVVCPAVDEVHTDDTEEMSNINLIDSFVDTSVPMKSAVAHTKYLSEALPNLRVGLVHGKQKKTERDTTMNSFVSGETDVLVSTTVIEVGVNVPNATLMIIENSERFGLSQLHQLRGRVGRGSAKSYMILVSDTKSADAQSRLRAIKETADGFKIAEYDLELRGPGDFIGSSTSIRQHGEVGLRLAAACRDTSLIESAAHHARQTAEADPNLTAPENAVITRMLHDYVSRTEKTSN